MVYIDALTCKIEAPERKFCNLSMRASVCGRLLRPGSRHVVHRSPCLHLFSSLGSSCLCLKLPLQGRRGPYLTGSIGCLQAKTQPVSAGMCILRKNKNLSRKYTSQNEENRAPGAREPRGAGRVERHWILRSFSASYSRSLPLGPRNRTSISDYKFNPQRCCVYSRWFIPL